MQASRPISSIGVVKLPTFVTGLILIYVFFLQLGIVPEPVDRIRYLHRTAAKNFQGFPVSRQPCSLRNWEALSSAAQRLALPSITMAIFVMVAADPK